MQSKAMNRKKEEAMQERIGSLVLAALLGGGVGVPAQTPSATVGLDRPSNGVLELSVRQIMRPRQGKNPAPEEWEGAMEITVKNISGLPVHLEESVLTYDLIVLDSSGGAVPRTEYGKQIEAAQRNGPSILPPTSDFDLRPGQEYTTTLGLRGLFKIEPGQDYTVKLRRWDRSMASIDESGKRIPLRELSRTLKGIGRPSIR